MDEYARVFDRVLAAKYIQQMRTRVRKTQSVSAIPSGAAHLPAVQALLPFGAQPDSSTKPGHPEVAYLMPRFVPSVCPSDLTDADGSRLPTRLDLCDCGCSNDPLAGPCRVSATLELPGVSKADIRVEVHQGWLVVEGVRYPPHHVRSPAARTPVAVRSHSASPIGGSTLGLILNHDSEDPFRRSVSPAHSDRSSGQDGLAAAGLTQAQQQDPAAIEDVEMTHEGVASAPHRKHPISEIRYGRFKRALKLPPGTDVSPHPLHCPRHI